MTKEELNKAVSDLIPEPLKKQFRDLKKKFADSNTPPPPATPTTPAPSGNSVTLDDGTQITYDTPTLQVGSKLMTVPADGSGAVKTPAGNYELSDGTLIVVDDNGAITSLTPPMAPEMPMMEKIMSKVKEALESELATKLADSTSKFSKLEKENEDLKKELGAVKAQFAEFFDIFSKVIDTPTGAPTEKPKNTFSETVNKKASILSQFSKK